MCYERIGIGVDIPSLARQYDEKGIFRLIELVAFCMVSCGDKQIFISRMMQIDEDKQTHLMYFIERLVDSRTQSPAESPVRLEHKEIRNLRSEKKRLTNKIHEMNFRIESMSHEKGELTSEIDELKLVNTDLQSELIRKSPIQYSSDSTIFNWELESQITEKEKVIRCINAQLEESRKKHIEEIAQLKDELDIANSKLIQFTNVQKNLDLYKKRYEKLACLKQQLLIATRQNEDHLKKLSQNEKDLKELEKHKETVKRTRDQAKIFQEKVLNLSHALEIKDVQIHDLIYQNKESTDKLIYYTDKLTVLEKELERYRSDSSPRTSEENSADFKKMYYEESIRILDARNHDMSAEPLHSISHQDLSKLDIEENKERIKEHTNILSRSEENLEMMQEDYLALADTHLRSVECYDTKINNLIDEIDSFRAWKSMQMDYKYEFDQLKIVNDWYVRELEGILNAKDELLKKFTEEKERNLQQAHTIQSLQTQIQSISSRIPILEKEIHDLSTQEAHETTMEIDKKETENLFLKIQDLEKDRIKHTSELSFLKSTLKQREVDLDITRTQNQTQLTNIHEEHRHFLIQTREESNQAIQILAKQTQDALEHLQRERDLLVKELKEYKCASIENLRDLIQKSGDEIYRKYQKARRLLHEKVKEIVYLKSSKEELRHAYEKCKKSLKSVMKTLGTETHRLSALIT